MILPISSIKSSNIASFSFKGAKRKDVIPCDVFQKRIQGVLWNEKKLQEIFDKTYAEVVRQHKIIVPEFQKLKLTKPKIELTPIDEFTAASYAFSNNLIKFDPSHLKEDYYSVDFIDEQGNIKEHAGTLTASQARVLGNIEKRYKNATYTKLTDKEKEAYIASCLAHELRHFVQNHLIASSATASDIQKSEYLKLYEEIKSVIATLNEEEKKDLGDYDVEKTFSYIRNYKPKTLLDENTLLKYSIFKEDSRYWSIQNHLLASEIQRLNSENEFVVDDVYKAMPTEVDAYRYQYEFFLSQIGKFDDNFRENFLCAMACELETYADATLSEMLAKGVCFESK